MGRMEMKDNRLCFNSTKNREIVIVAGKPTLNQADGIHPTAEGHALMAEVVLKGIKPWRTQWKSN